MRRPRLHFLTALAAALAAGCGSGPRPDGPNVLLITLDTTRRDHLGCYGYPRPTTPNLDALASEAVVYTNAYAVSSWTMPAHASLFTGKYPSSHGARYDSEGVLHLDQGIAGNFGHYRAQPIADDETTLAQILGRAGWRTGGIAGGPWMKRVFRLDRGFDFYDDDHISEVNGRSGQDITRVAKTFLEEGDGSPFFLFLNYYDPHGPYKPESFDWVRRVLLPGENPNDMDPLERMRLLYDAEIRYMDAAIGELFRSLREAGLWENTWIVVTADHGELLGEPLLGGGPLQGHGHTLSQAEIHIPMIVKPPGPPKPRRDPAPVQQTDVLPTILAGLGLPTPSGVQGRPFGARRGPIFAEVYPLEAVRPTNGDWRKLGDWRVIFDGPYKFGWNSLQRHFLVNLEDDPDETRNIIASHPDRARELEQRLTKLVRSLPAPGHASGGSVDPSTFQALQGLGYVGGDEGGG